MTQLSDEVVERLRKHIADLDEHGAGNVERLSYDDLCAILDLLEAYEAKGDVVLDEG